MLISLIVTSRENVKEIEELSLTAFGELEWNDPSAEHLQKTVSVVFSLKFFFLCEELQENKDQQFSNYKIDKYH